MPVWQQVLAGLSIVANTVYMGLFAIRPLHDYVRGREWKR